MPFVLSCIFPIVSAYSAPVSLPFTQSVGKMHHGHDFTAGDLHPPTAEELATKSRAHAAAVLRNYHAQPRIGMEALADPVLFGQSTEPSVPSMVRL